MFATEAGAAPACDPLLITGVVFGKRGAEPEAIAFYRELERAPEFVAPRPWRDCRAEDFDSLLLAGGHAPGMRQYLGSEVVQQLTAAMFATPKPIAAICHGVLVAARYLLAKRLFGKLAAWPAVRIADSTQHRSGVRIRRYNRIAIASTILRPSAAVP